MSNETIPLNLFKANLELQLRLQRTGEGLSTVAISYYAVNLAAYALEPLAHQVHLSHGALLAILTPVVLLGVWLMNIGYRMKKLQANKNQN